MNLDPNDFPIAAAARWMRGSYRDAFLRLSIVNGDRLYERVRRAFEFHSEAVAQ